jgi:hypothetical protein
MTALKALLFLILAPALLGVYIPLAYPRVGPQIETGTPAPIDPPKELVVAGLYRTRSQIALFQRWKSAICDRGYYISPRAQPDVCGRALDRFPGLGHQYYSLFRTMIV